MEDIMQIQINKIQQDYLSLLKKIPEEMTAQEFLSVVDCVAVFWTKHRHIVASIVKHYVIPRKTFILTGASRMDVSNFRHYPFLSIGEKHIMDDPLCRFMEATRDIKLESAVEEFARQVKLTIKDNIKLLEECFPHIIVLPLRYLIDLEDELINEVAIKIFVSLFDDEIQTFDDYKKLKSIEDIHKHILPQAIKMFVFDYDDDTNDDLISRFNLFLERDSNYKFLNGNHNGIFFLAIIGHITQTLYILLMCLETKCFPFIRDEVAFKYFISFSGGYIKDEDKDEIKKIILGSAIGYILYNEFDVKEFETLSLEEYISLLKKCDSKDRIFTLLGDIVGNSPELKLAPIVESVKKYLDELIREKNNVNS